MSRSAKLSMVGAAALLVIGAAGGLAVQQRGTTAPAASLLAAATRAIAHGHPDEAEALARARPGADAAAILARLAERKGQYEEAERLLDGPSAAAPASEAALELGLLLQLRGRQGEARPVLQAVLLAAGAASEAEALLRGARAAQALGQVRAANDNLFPRANRAKPGDPAVNTAWGQLLLERGYPDEALPSFEAALKTDPEWAPALLGAAQASSDLGRPGDADLASRAARIDPGFVAAHLFMAESALDRDKLAEARAAVDRALAVNPREPAAHALLAAMAYVDGRTRDFDTEVGACLAVNPTYGEVYRVAAERSARNNRYDEAVALAEKGLALEPGNLRTAADLGMHLLRLGDEAHARDILERTFKADPFDRVTYNLLRLLDTLATFQSFPGTNAVVRLDKAEAPVLRHYAQPIVQEAFAKYTARYGFTPQGPILVEIFPKHDDFAVRTFGLPGLLGALGACFGRVVTLDSPRARDPGTYNWQSALWHEMAHVFTLQLSKERVPRWLTEGISVWEEGRVRPEWARDSEMSFAKAYVDGKVPKLADLNGAFTKPETIALAYFQASVVVDLLVQRFGDQALRALLVAYGDGLDTDAALRKAAGTSVADLQRWLDDLLEKRFRALGRALEMPKDAEIPRSGDRATLEAFASRYPGSYPVQLAVGQLLVRAGARPAAFAAFQRAAALVPDATGTDSPHARMAALAEEGGDAGRALAELKALVAYDHTNVEAARRLAALAEKAGDEQARRLAYERIVTVDPFDAGAHTSLGRLALARGDGSAALREFQAALDAGVADPVSAHCDLGDAFLASGKPTEAKQEALAALKIAPRFERAQDLLLKAIEK